MSTDRETIFSELEGLIAAVPDETLPDLMGELERLRGLLMARLFKVRPENGQEFPPNQRNKKYLDVKEVAKLLGLSKASVYLLVRNGKIPSVRFGKHIRIRVEDLKKQGISEARVMSLDRSGG